MFQRRVRAVFAAFLAIVLFLGGCGVSHVCEFDLQKTDAAFLRSPATCAHGATYFYSCSCGKVSTEFFETEERAEHDFRAKNTDEKYLKAEETCRVGAEYYYSCIDCGTPSEETFFLVSSGICRFENQLPEERYLKNEATPASPAEYYKSCVGCGEAGSETFFFGVLLQPGYIPKELSYELVDFRKDIYEFTWITEQLPLDPKLQVMEGPVFDENGDYQQYSATMERNPEGHGYLMTARVPLKSDRVYTYRAYDRYSQMGSEPTKLRTQDTALKSELYLMGASGSQMFGCVVQTKNHTIVFDGGWSTDAKQLADFLKEHADSKVDAWFFTHPHQDHVGAFYQIAKSYPEIEIGAVYYNAPSLEAIDTYGRKGTEADMWRKILPLLETKFKDRAHITQANDVYFFDRVKVKVLRVYNPALTAGDFVNEASSVYRVESMQSSLLILGDLGPGGAAEVMKNCALADLKTDYTQMAHHGQAGASKEFYEYIQVKKCLWPTPEWLWNNDNGGGYDSGPWGTLETRKWMEDLGVVRHYVAKDGTQKIPF